MSLDIQYLDEDGKKAGVNSHWTHVCLWDGDGFSNAQSNTVLLTRDQWRQIASEVDMTSDYFPVPQELA